ncbi:GNAT family N-acetyltransferase [Streptosporangium vulgare]|uniref:GNAT family N-acetyltransferase n=1 Tax=Streptosporangium vulgare TaxID=46190 RepID=UPI0031D99B44
MRISVIRPAELGPAEIAAWRRMQRSSPHLDNPFLSPDFTIAMGEVSAEARVAVITESDGPVGFFPFERHGGGVGAALGWWVSLSQGVVHRPGAEFDSDALLKACGLSVWEFGCMVDRQPWFQPFETLRQEAVVLDFGGGYSAFLDELRERSPKFLKSTLYKERKLGRDVGEVTAEFAVRDPARFRLLREWKSAQYQRMGRPDRFGKAWVVELVERLHAVDTDDFAGPLSMLYAGGRPVAGHFGLRTGTTMIGWFPAYDPEYAKYSPGLIQHLRMVESAAKLGVTSPGSGHQQRLGVQGRAVQPDRSSHRGHRAPPVGGRGGALAAHRAGPPGAAVHPRQPRPVRRRRQGDEAVRSAAHPGKTG